MKLPKSIKLGSRSFKFSEVQDLKDGDATLYGFYRHKAGELLVEKTLVDDHKAEVIIHEVLHGIFYMMLDKRQMDDKEELIVEQISKGLATVMKDNPKLIAALMEGLRG